MNGQLRRGAAERRPQHERYISRSRSPGFCAGHCILCCGPAGRWKGGTAVMDIIELGILSYRLEAGINAARAIHEAMINGDCEPEGWLCLLYTSRCV